MIQIDIPETARTLMHYLGDSGYTSYIVGGCVRDSLLGRKPNDWDICTSALPADMVRVFSEHGLKCIETGLKHGTLTVGIDNDFYEVTTLRIDGGYTDGRHPNSVQFTNSLAVDLSRRDFTINAMAYNPVIGFTDPFGGKKDLEKKQVRCVGVPYNRFSEDALRVLRAIRFASTYGFSVERETSQAIHNFATKLGHLSAERIYSELCKILCGDYGAARLMEYSDVLVEIIPELKPCVLFQQHNPYHDLTVLDHILYSVGEYHGKDVPIKLALLLHDIGKPECFTQDEKGTGHFYGHASVSRDIAAEVLQRLRVDNQTKNEVLTLILYHDSDIALSESSIRRWLNRVGVDTFKKLLEVKRADIKAQSNYHRIERLEYINSVERMLRTVLDKALCFSIKDMNINGRDIMSLGVKEGIMVGQVLGFLFEGVISGNFENSKEVLMEKAKEYLTEVKN